MLIRIISLILFLIVGIFITADWIHLFSKLKGVKNTIIVLLTGLLGPLSMFYWGIWVGIASILALMISLIPWSFLDLQVNIWFHLTRTLVFLWMSLKINTLTKEEMSSLKMINFNSLLHLIWQIVLGFLLYGFMVYLLWKIII